MNTIVKTSWIILALAISAAALAQAPAGEEPAADPSMEDPAEVVEDNFGDDEPVPPDTTGDDVTAQEEVESGEEISEDYPVPLPSDI